MSWDDVMQRIMRLETENEDLQKQLAEANDYIEHYEDARR